MVDKRPPVTRRLNQGRSFNDPRTSVLAVVIREISIVLITRSERAFRSPGGLARILGYTSYWLASWNKSPLQNYYLQESNLSMPLVLFVDMPFRRD
jgi:hypothetical protein